MKRIFFQACDNSCDTVLTTDENISYDDDMPIAESPEMKNIISYCTLVAPSDSSIVITGDSGTGKEVIAKFIHKSSNRSEKPFIPVNCAAIPSELLESEFFGYVKGAFTGANVQGKAGLFEMANNGTIFLDEISELPLHMQPKLLRAIESGYIQRLGSVSLTKTNVRIITATNRDLKAMCHEGFFRMDLYYRINVIPIHLIPLRCRSNDIIALANKFLHGLNKKNNTNKRLLKKSYSALMNYHWPGNARELRNFIERIYITNSEEIIEIDDHLLENPEHKTEELSNSGDCEQNIYLEGTLKEVLKKVEQKYISKTLEECDGKISEAADRLGIHRTMLYRKIHDINDSKNTNYM